MPLTVTAGLRPCRHTCPDSSPLPASTVIVPAATSGYDDDDEDEDEEAEVMLGFVEKPKHLGLLLRHLFPSKDGGIPFRAITPIILSDTL